MSEQILDPKAWQRIFNASEAALSRLPENARRVNKAFLAAFYVLKRTIEQKKDFSRVEVRLAFEAMGDTLEKFVKYKEGSHSKDLKKTYGDACDALMRLLHQEQGGFLKEAAPFCVRAVAKCCALIASVAVSYKEVSELGNNAEQKGAEKAKKRAESFKKLRIVFPPIESGFVKLPFDEGEKRAKMQPTRSQRSRSIH